MGSFTSKESASDLRREYARGIRQFLSGAQRYERDGLDSSLNAALNHYNSFPREDADLRNLLDWARTALTSQRALQTRVTALDSKCTVTQTRNTELTRQLGEVQSQLDSAEAQRRAAEDRHRHAISQLTSQHAQAISRLTAQHAQELQETNQRYERMLRVQQAKFSDQLAQREYDIKKLQGQLLVSHDKNLAWPDEKLKIRIGEVRRLIDNATARMAAANLVPRGRVLPSRLDPTNTLVKVNGKTHFWLRARLWAALQFAFFSHPFGFGAFGPSSGVSELLAIYGAWRTRLDGYSSLDPQAEETFAIFRKSPLSNKWRSVTFQCLAIASLGGTDPATNWGGVNVGSPGAGVMTRLGQENVESCIRDMSSFLADLSALSHVPLYSELQDDIRNMVQLSFEIALQFGVNQANLNLLTTIAGETVVIGNDFHDCEDAEANRGTRTRVDFMVSPGLQRIGDGRQEMARKNTVVPCEIFSAAEP
ncbi:hypothetical protein B0H66DRAFT_571190 [Apodospora peruviana]|uniref:Uncharacterized protein n=1 Tax=Apodospora peruviana TaxID=516989 RepID=A0AAE0HTW0_9PEZI|nr:hypothetical protein B0H66DRAFT_571190 [Apodospora peruviana]